MMWLQLLIGWVPIWALFAILIGTQHDVPFWRSALFAARMIAAAAVLGLAVHRLVDRFPWPHPFRIRFIALHVLGALAYSVAFLTLNSLIESLVRGRLAVVVGPGVFPFLITGMWLYLTIVGVSYTTRATERAARAEAAATKSQLAALRSQLNPHFLFNALHSIVHLIPRDPSRAAQAAEQLGGLLRETIEERRDLVPLAEELAFVDRYLHLQRLRFGDRLVSEVRVDDAAQDELVPSFALLTLVENAVRHGAERREGVTRLSIAAPEYPDRLMLVVHDTSANGERADGSDVTEPDRNGTGLQRLRERLAVLYGNRAQLTAAPDAAGGFTASLSIPRGA